MRAYTRAGLGLANTSSHRIGQEQAIYLTLAPVNRVVKNGVFLRGAYFSVLVFRSARAALSAMTALVKAQLSASEEPWVIRRNLILVSRTPMPQPATSSFGPNTNATWAARETNAHPVAVDRPRLKGHLGTVAYAVRATRDSSGLLRPHPAALIAVPSLNGLR
jgi:hypothetical protein